MESPAQRDARIERLEQGRSRRQAVTEIAPGRGDLERTSSTWVGSDELGTTELLLVGDRNVSFARLFQSQPWVAAAVMRMLTWAVRVPLKVYRRTGDDSRERLREGDHPLAAAVVNPWQRGNMAGLIQSLLGPILVHGNSVTEVILGRNDSIQFSSKDWRYVLPLRPFRDSLEGFKVDIDQPRLAREVSIDSIVHVAWWSPAGPIGTSPLQQLGVTLRNEDASQRYQNAMLKNSARPPSAVTASDEFLGIEREERSEIMRQLRKDITDLYSGPENQGRPALLPPGLDWKVIGHTAQEAELIEQRKIAREEITGVYLIPPPMLGILDKATYSNIETQREMVYTDCLGPPLVLIEQCLNSQVIRSLLQEDDVYCEFDFAGVLRGDRLKEIQALREAIGTALLTPNEGRAVLNMEKDSAPEMDDFYLPTNNLSPIGAPPPARPASPPPAPAQSRLLVRSREADYELVP